MPGETEQNVISRRQGVRSMASRVRSIASQLACALAGGAVVLALSAAPAMAGRIEPGPKAGQASPLPFTGINTLLLVGVGVSLIGAGMLARRVARHGGAVHQHG